VKGTRHACRVILLPTPDAIVAYNKTRGETTTIGLFHVTC